MSDNITSQAVTSSGSVFAADDISSVYYPRSKITIGADGVNDGDVSSSNPMPVTHAAFTELAAAINSSQVDVNIAASGATVPVSNAGLTELAAAINASSQMDVNIAASGATVPVSNAGLTELAAAINVSSQMDVNLAAQAGAITVSATNLDIRDLTSGSDSVAAVCTNSGTFATQVSGDALTALQLIDNPVLVDDAAFTPATSSVMMAGFEADETATDSVDEGDAGAARMTLDRKVITTPQPHTTGGLSIFRSLDLDESEEDVKTSAGQVYGWWIYNAATTVRYVKFYNAAAADVTVGSSTPVLTLPIPAATSGGVAANMLGAHGIAFSTAICVACTTALADNDTGAPSAGDCVINLFYK